MQSLCELCIIGYVSWLKHVQECISCINLTTKLAFGEASRNPLPLFCLMNLRNSRLLSLTPRSRNQFLLCNIRVTKTPSARQQCWPESFCKSGKFLRQVHYWLNNFRILCNTKYPDNMQTVRMNWKVSGQSKKCPDNLENVSGKSKKNLDDLEMYI